MKLSKDEIIKKLAEAIIDVQTTVNPEDADRCTFCYKEHSINYNKYPHELDCPVLLAEEVLKETKLCSCCNGVDYHLPNGLNCPVCNGSGLTQIGDGEDWERTVNCDSCNGTGTIKEKCGCIDGYVRSSDSFDLTAYPCEKCNGTGVKK